MDDMSNPEFVMQAMVDDLRDRIETESRAIRFANARMEALAEAHDAAESALGRYQRAKEAKNAALAEQLSGMNHA